MMLMERTESRGNVSYRSTTLRSGGPALLAAQVRTLTIIALTVATIVAKDISGGTTCSVPCWE